MECYRRAMISEQSFEGRREALNQANKLSRTYATLLDALNRHRGKGQQKVTVEHVHVHSGGQAIVGTVERPTPVNSSGTENYVLRPDLDSGLMTCRVNFFLAPGHIGRALFHLAPFNHSRPAASAASCGVLLRTTEIRAQSNPFWRTHRPIGLHQV
jgi:hypothetical protein